MNRDAFDHLDPAMLAQSSRIVFLQGFGLDLHDGQALEPPPSGRWVTGSIFFSGDWCGLLRVEMPFDLALGLTGTWLELDPSQLTAGAVQDAIGELANTVAGILKPALPGIRGMSVPRVAETDLSQSKRDPTQTLRQVLLLAGQPLQVSLWKCPPQFKMLVVPKPNVGQGGD